MAKLGRPPGSKNKLTLLKEAESAKAVRLCQGTILQYAPQIVKAMCLKALEGDVKAAQLVMNRVYPEMRQVDKQLQGIQGITININSESPNGNDQRQGETITVAHKPANGAQPFHAEGGEVVAEDGGEEGHQQD